MESIIEDRDIENQATVNFTHGVSMRDLINGEGTIFEIKQDDAFMESDKIDYDPHLPEYTPNEGLGLEDEDTYNDEAFEDLAEKMTNLLSDGKVKKRVLREGVGLGLPDDGLVTYDYNAYVEYNPLPFDSSYSRNRSHKLRLGNGDTLPGLEVAIKSMKISEKSQFLIHPDLAYGRLGCLSRVPPDTQVLFEVEIKNCVNSGALLSFQNLSRDEQRDFSNAYKYALALCEKGNNFFSEKRFKPAIKEYYSAVAKLENCILADENDQEVQQKLLLRLYTNLVVTNTKVKAPRKACQCANEIHRLVKGTCLKIPAKVYFNAGRSLMMLGDFESAKQRLLKAKEMDPTNEAVGAEFVKLDEMMAENYNRETKLAEVIFNNVDKRQQKSEVTDRFKATLKEWFNDLNNDPNQTNYTLPIDLSEVEINYVKTNAPQFGLLFGERKGTYFIYKEAEH